MKKNATESLQSRANGRATREKILRATARVIADQGAGGVSIAALAEEVGITRRAFYHHFASRDELMAAVSTHLEKQLQAATRDSDQVDDPFWLVGATAALSAPLLRAQLIDILSRGPRHSTLFKNVRDQVHRMAEEGLLQDGVDVDMAVYSAFIPLFGALLATDQGRGKQQKLELGERYMRESKRMMIHGLFKPSADDE